MCHDLFYKMLGAQNIGLALFSRGPGGFREVRKAGRNHFHLSWCLSVSVVKSYGQKPWGGEICLPSTVSNKKLLNKKSGSRDRNFLSFYTYLFLLIRYVF